MKLNKKQTIALDRWEDKTTNEIEYGGAAGGGKSILGSYALLKNALRYPKTRWLMGRAKLKTLKETTLQSFFKVAQMQGVRNGVHYKYTGANDKDNPNSLVFYNGSVILLKDLFYYPSDPNFDELGSLEITGAFVDENNQLCEKAWNIVRSRIRHDVEKNNLIPKMLGSCNPSKNFVYHNFYKPSKDGKLTPDKAFIQALVTDNPDIDKYYIENLHKLDPISRARLLDGNWEYDDDPAIMMQYDKIVDLFTNTHILGGNKYITCDAARLGKDRSIIRVWQGLTSIRKVVIPKCRIDDLANSIRQLQREYGVPNSNTIVDEDGVGGGVVDILRCKGFVNNSKPIIVNGKQPNYSNLRSQCYFKLASVVNDNLIYLPDEPINDRDIVVEELELIKQKDIDKDGKIAVISKDEIKKVIGRSIDEADTIMMRMWFELVPKRPKTKIHIPQG